MRVELIRHTKAPLEAVASAAANCYNSEPSSKIVSHCYNSGHHSVLEFADFHFRISEVSRALSHQLVRHRLASYAQRSQRYVDESGFRYVTPGTIEDSALNDDYDDLMIKIAQFYYKATKAGIPAEDARFALPNACHTTLDMKMNLRELMNFTEERLCNRAQWEIRNMAHEMVKLVGRVSAVGAYLVPKCVRLKYCPEAKGGCGRMRTFEELFK